MKHLSNLDNLIFSLKKKKIKLCIAESLTGGSLAYEFIKKQGASNFFEFSIVCYSNDSKNTFFGITEGIDKFGLVSKEVATLMIKRLDRYTSTKKNLKFSCTGYAGPNKNSSDIEVGTVYIGLGYMNKIKVFKKKFKNYGRKYIINKTINVLIDEGQKIINL